MLYKQVLAVVILSTGFLSSGLAVGAEYEEKVPPPPKNLIIATCAREVSLRWSAAGTSEYEIYQFRIYRGTSSENESFYTSVDASTRVYKDPHGDRDQTFYYYITAVNRYGESKPSEEVKATPTCGPIQPSPPSNLCYRRNEGNIELRWDEPLYHGGYDVHQYRIYRNTTDGDFELYDIVKGMENKYVDHSVSSRSSYRYYVTALNSIGPSENSDIIEINLENDEKHIMNFRLIFSITLVIVFLIFIGKEG